MAPISSAEEGRDSKSCFAREVEQIIVRAQHIGALQGYNGYYYCLHLGGELSFQRWREDSGEFEFLNFMSNGLRGLVQMTKLRPREIGQLARGTGAASLIQEAGRISCLCYTCFSSSLLSSRLRCPSAVDPAWWPC